MYSKKETIKVKLAELKPHPKNPKLHNDELIEKSIGDLGYAENIVIDENNVILSGHGRVKALIKKGYAEDEAIRITGWTEEEKEKYLLLANQSTILGGFDEMLLKDFSGDILDYSGLDSDILIEPDEKDDIVPENVPPVAKLGDLWQLGRHRLLCGDATKIEDVERLMGGVYPDLIHTDPPYGMNAVTKSGVLSKNYKKDIIGDDNPDIAKQAFSLIYSLYPKSKQIWWGANYYCSVLPDSECWLVWDKDNGQSDQTDCELAWANFRSVIRQFTQSSEKTNRVHPTQKPVSLVGWIMRRFKFTADTIADFFGGSGVTLIAAEKEGKTCYTMEMDEHYCDVIIKRWEDYTGLKAEKL